MDGHPRTAADFNEIGVGRLPGHLGIEIVSVTGDRVEARMALEPAHLTPHGYLHAASAVALADSACGYGCIAGLPDGSGFTTIELKAIFWPPRRRAAWPVWQPLSTVVARRSFGMRR